MKRTLLNIFNLVIKELKSLLYNKGMIILIIYVFSVAIYIGGTKVGALFGEAVIICAEHLKNDFRYIIKQKGGMLAKGWLLGLQFVTLLEHGLYFKIAEHANKMAQLIHDAFAEKGIAFLYDSPTNQQFPILKNNDLNRLSETFISDFWCTTDSQHTAVRFCTSWATKKEDVETLIKAIKKL